MNFLFTTWEGGGNVTPALEAVRKLVARGHHVRVMSEECNRPESEAAGARFIAWRRAPNRTARTPETDLVRDWAAESPQDALISVVRDTWAGPALAHAQDVIEELTHEPADLVVTCEGLFGVMAGCERLNQRFVTLCPNISLTPQPGIPPLGPGLPPARNDDARAFHRDLANMLVALLDTGLPSLNNARTTLGLAPLEHLLDQFKPAVAELLATSRAFDFPSDQLPKKVRYVGPQIGDPHWAQPWTSPWPQDDTRPLIAVSFSTTFQNHAHVLQNVIDALSTLPARVLVTLGGSIKRDTLRAPENTVLLDSAPHSQVMKHAALVITHGGHGTVMRALLNRLPILVIPHGRDQNDNAIRVTQRRAGLSLTPDASIDTIRDACTRLLNDPKFKIAAKNLGDQIAIDTENSTIIQELESAATAECEYESTRHAVGD